MVDMGPDERTTQVIRHAQPRCTLQDACALPNTVRRAVLVRL